MARPPVYLSEAEDAPAMLGAAEVAALLGITTSRVKQLAHMPDFPPPVVRLSMGTAWYREDVEAWAAANADIRARHDPRRKENA